MGYAGIYTHVTPIGQDKIKSPMNDLDNCGNLKNLKRNQAH